MILYTENYIKMSKFFYKRLFLSNANNHAWNNTAVN